MWIMASNYLVKLETFEGPMDLLMHLIEKNKIDLYDIPIAELTKQYLAYIDAAYEFDIEFASEFLVMAATLLRIKSRMMLPKTDAETSPDEDPRMARVQTIQGDYADAVCDGGRAKRLCRTSADISSRAAVSTRKSIGRCADEDFLHAAAYASRNYDTDRRDRRGRISCPG